MARVWVSVVTVASLLKRIEGDLVTQATGPVLVSEGDPVLLNCTYEVSGYPSPFWYVQRPGRPLQLFLRDTGSQDSDEGRRGGFDAKAERKPDSFHLRKAAAELSDSATYYCAVRNNNNYNFIFGNGTKLVVEPKLDNSPPSIYPLTSDNKNLLACLVTDFFPGNISVGSRPNAKLTSLNASLVVMKGSGEASYGTVLWGPRDELACTADHDNQNFQLTDFDEEDDTCMIVEMDENFETDKNLNFLSLTLLGLRIVFVKTVAINLLLTLSQWKR